MLEKIREQQREPSSSRKRITALVSVVTEEYRQSPLIATITRSCILDRAILSAMCKSCKATGAQEASVSDILERLGHLIDHHLMEKNKLIEREKTASIGGVAKLVLLIMPPLSIFEEAIERLISQVCFE